MDQIQYEMRSKIGLLYLVANQNGLSGIFFKKQKVKMTKSADLSTPEGKVLAHVIKQLEEYFLGKRKDFTIDLSFTGTPFQNQVWRQLSRIPFGKTVSYSNIAKKINNPKAVRAVGSANGKNPFCIVVPCHRVISADGSLGGYGGGLKIKRQLLKLEGINDFDE